MFSHVPAESRFSVRPAGAAPEEALLKAFVKAEASSPFVAMLNVFD
jgi:hypothetical protein